MNESESGKKEQDDPNLCTNADKHAGHSWIRAGVVVHCPGVAARRRDWRPADLRTEPAADLRTEPAGDLRREPTLAEVAIPGQAESDDDPELLADRAAAAAIGAPLADDDDDLAEADVATTWPDTAATDTDQLEHDDQDRQQAAERAGELAGDFEAHDVAGDQLDAYVNEQACPIVTAHDRHSYKSAESLLQTGQPYATCPGIPPADVPDQLGSYADMFASYLSEQTWIDGTHAPLVFHIRKLCRRLDTDDDAPASYASAYLQAISRLERMRPGSKQPSGRPDGGQPSIFDEMD